MNEGDNGPRLEMWAIDRINDVIEYNPTTGDFSWKSRRASGRKQSGTCAGWVNSGNGYRYIDVYNHGRRFRVLAHRLAWAITSGSWPEEEIDHINGDRTDNRLANLRPATRRQNSLNCKIPSRNKSGVRGVHWCSRRNKWVAQIKIGPGVTKNIGRFDDIDAAKRAYELAAASGYGEFRRQA